MELCRAVGDAADPSCSRLAHERDVAYVDPMFALAARIYSICDSNYCGNTTRSWSRILAEIPGVLDHKCVKTGAARLLAQNSCADQVLKNTALLAQMVERTAFNRVVEGSIPSGGALWCSFILRLFLKKKCFSLSNEY